MLSTFGTPATAQTLLWDPPNDPTVVGYIVTLSNVADNYQTTSDVGNQVSMSLAGLARDRTWRLCVQSYTLYYLLSPCSATVELPATQTSDPKPPKPPGEDTNTTETYDAWATRFGVGVPSADDDGDELTNNAEYLKGTDPTIPNRWLLAEGADGAFTEELAIVNPGTTPADVRVRGLGVSGPAGEGLVRVPAASRATVMLSDVIGPDRGAVGADIDVEKGGAYVERTTSWPGSGSSTPAHSGRAMPKPSLEWYFADGDATTFDTFLMLANPGTTRATVSVEFLVGKGKKVKSTYDVAPSARVSVWCNQVSGLAGKTFAATVKSSVPIVAERSVYFWRGTPQWTGGHSTAGSASLSTNWWFAEGRTGRFFETYLLLANPGTQQASVTVRYLTAQGTARTDVVQIPAATRSTIIVDKLVGLAETDVSMEVTSTLPVVAERTMYWPGTPVDWRDGHSSAGATRTGKRWLLADGRWGGASSWEAYVVVMNPNATATRARVRVLREGGLAPIDTAIDIPARRTSILRIDGAVGVGSGERFGVVIDADLPVVVERSMYAVGGGLWSGGTNEGALRIR